MPRRPNTKPTSIYWLYDVRPETIAEGWPDGKPFYCGKTVATPHVRLIQHRTTATRKPHGDVGPRVVECGQFVRIQVMEIVPARQNWADRERFWIATGRLLYSGCFLNVADGGQGTAGYIPSAKHIAKVTATKIGRKHSPERCANIAAAHHGRKHSPERCAKMSAGMRGKKRSPETRAKMSAAKRGYKPSLEARAKMSAAKQGKKLTPEHRANIAAGSQKRQIATWAVSN